MSPKEIITRKAPSFIELRTRSIERGVTFAAMARELGVTRQLISRIASGHGTSRRVLEYIYARLGFSEYLRRGAK